MGKKANRSGGKHARERYHSEFRRHSNKNEKQAKHAIRKEAGTIEKAERISLIDKCVQQYSLPIGRGTYILKRFIGTLNKKRLNALISGDLVHESWFQNRKASPILVKLLKPTRVPSEYLDHMIQ